MTKRTFTARPAHIAIAAMLALGTTPVLAQDASGAPAAGQPAQGTPVMERLAPPPATTSAPVPTTAAPQPQIVLPETTAPAPQPSTARVLRLEVPEEAPAATPAQRTATSPTSTDAAPVTSRSSAASTAARTTERNTTRSTVPQPATQSDDASAASAPLASQALTTDAEQIAPEETPVAAPVMSQPESMTAQPQADEGLTLSEIISLALMGLVPIGILALLLFAFARRRKRAAAVRAEYSAPATAEETADTSAPVRTNVTPMPASPMIAEEQDAPSPQYEPSPAVITPVHAARMQRRGAAGGLPHTGASVALPAKAPEDPEQREALLRRMTEAKPDRANPFTARKARRHRAKLILASLGRRFADGPPKMDLSQYPNNWPELAQRSRQVAA